VTLPVLRRSTTPMRKPTSDRRPLWFLVLPSLLFDVAFAEAGAMPLNKEEQARVERAIDGGVAYLKRSQGPQGSWAGPWERHTVGYAALPGLTLLECGVPADDPVIRRIAEIVRRDAPKLDFTYEIALSILFLNRLGEAKDRELIQTLAVRLIAGQMKTGGWTYGCPFVAKKSQEEILAALHKLDPPEPLEGAAKRPAAPLEGITAGKPSAPPAGSAPKPAKATPTKAKPFAKKEGQAASQPPEVPAALKKLAVFRDPDQIMKLLSKGRPSDSTDNSNTQFALLALWVAQRHGVTAQRSMRMIVRRFESSQNPDGSWSYGYRFGGGLQERPAMTCVGLLGLAVGHGIAPPRRAGNDPKPADLDRIRAGFAALSKNVGKPSGKWRNQPLTDLYLLWSVERVGVLYSLPTIGDNDWYRWGAEMLIANQQKRGFWTGGGYPGASSTLDTCLALLFLKRTNFVADLSAKLRIKPEELNQSIIRAAPYGSISQSRNPDKP
jgi:hypothetical protein